MPNCKTPADLRFALKKLHIELVYKFKKTTNEIEGVSFRYDNVNFKGSKIDRKFSFGNLKKEFEKNIEEAKERGREELLREQTEQEEAKQQSPPLTKRNLVIKGVELSDDQEETVRNGGYIFLKNMVSKDGKMLLSAYVFLNDDQNRAFLSKENPDEFVKYGKYEMRVRDKILVENGYMTKAKVKWYGGGFAYPYLWKENKADIEYKESFHDPRVPKEKKLEMKTKQSIVQQKNRGRKR